MDSPNRGNTIGRGGQLRSNLGIRRCPTLQRKQAHDHLQAVQQPMIGFLAQNGLPLDQVILFGKQSLILGESRWQPGFRSPMSGQLPFVARNGAKLTTFKDNIRLRICAGR